MKGIILTLPLLCFSLTYGFSRFKRRIPNGYGVNHPCPGKGHWDAVGHMNGGYTPQKNVFGQSFKEAGARWTRELCLMDSDGDGLTNGEELGDPECKWRPRDTPAEPAKGHPGFCEEDRLKCESGMTHGDCPNPRANGQGRGQGRGRGRGQGRGRGRGRTPPRRLPPGANDHPQTTLSKNLDQRGGFGQSLPGYDMVDRSRGVLLSQPPGFQSSSGRLSMGSGGFDRSFGGQSRRPSVEFDTSGSRSFGPAARPEFTTSGTGSFGAPSLSQDFGVSEERYIGRRPSGRGGTSGTSLMTGRGDFSRDRFSSSLDQRSIQGIGSPVPGPSFQSPMSQSEIERSVQARMDRERSHTSGSGGMRSSMGSASMGFSSMESGGMRPGSMDTMGGRRMSSMGGGDMGLMGGGGMGSVGGDGMGSIAGGSMGSVGSGGMGPVGPGSMDPRGMGSMDPRSVGSMGPGGTSPMGPSGMSPMGFRFSGGMERYPPFMMRGYPAFRGPPFSGGIGASFSGGGMSMPGIPGSRFTGF